MSLDVYLYNAPQDKPCPECGHVRSEQEYVYSANITHNLGKMAMKAGLYGALWEPEQIGAVKAGDIIHVLTVGLAKLKADPAYFKTFDAPNGWGTYENFVPWVERYLEACKEYPEAEISVSR